MHSPDIHDLRSFNNEGRPYGILVQFMIGAEGGQGEDSFDAIVCSEDMLDSPSKETDSEGEHYVVLNNFDYFALQQRVERLCHDAGEGTWDELADRLNKFAKWEFDNYRGEILSL